MKKIIALLLTLVLALSVVACTKNENNNTNDLNNATNETEEATPNETEEVAPSTDATVAQTLVSEFKTLAADTSLDAQAIADSLLGSAALANVGMMTTMPIEDVYLSGFDNYEVHGFTECVMFAPMIGVIPFVGYVFTVGDGVDANAFAADLEANANLRWNICVSADEVATSVEGTKVLFVMAPMSFEGDSEAPIDDGIGGMDIGEEVPAFDGEMAE